MTTVLLDSHVLHWWSPEPATLSRAATKQVEAADELAVASITWFELAWLAEHGRIVVAVPVRSWLEDLAVPHGRHDAGSCSHRGRSAVILPGGLRDHRHPRPVTVW